MVGHETQRSLHHLMDRFESLEASHQKLQQQFQLLVEEKAGNGSSRAFPGNEEMASDSGRLTSFPGLHCFPGSYLFGSPYRSVLEYMGHAVHVTRTGSGQIIYWNFAAEKLYGYKDDEVIGQSMVEVLFDEEHHGSVIEIMDRLSSGTSWSGQLPLKKRSGESFMGMVSKSPLYEEGKLTGIISVSSDAAVFNNTSSGNNRKHNENHADGQTKLRRINLKKIQWHPQAQVLAVPELSSSISNLASKVLLRKPRDATSDTREIEESEVESQGAKADRPPRVPIRKPSFGLSQGKNNNGGTSSQKEDSTSVFVQPPKIAVKLLSKLQRVPIGNPEEVVEDDIQQTSSEDNRMIKNAEPNEAYFNKKSMGSESVANEPNIKSMDSDDTRLDSPKIPSSGNSSETGPHSSSTTKSESDCHMVMGPEIRWEDIQLKEEIGHGSFAVVYRGVWSGLDVAVKVYSGGQYAEETLVDYKKEINIMRRLRHPNVLLFMGAVCTCERLAMVTEYLSRGSLFKILHRNRKSLDIKRRLRIATDVARGMNYLHHRNPPIVHRDLKSSNLLVDKSWTVKVGDFGLSKLKYATFLTAKSGRGTPQWMAPEVLRNEPSTEKSDVFSFGVILWELMTERIPWDDLNSLQVVGVVGFMDRRLDLPDNIDPRVRSIISDCWRSNPEDRPSFEDILRKMTGLVHTRGNVAAKKPPTA